VYTYKDCSTCKKALAFLDEHGVAYKNIPIRDTPPSKRELKRMLDHLGGSMKRLFNTTGGDYRALNLKETLGEMPDEEPLALLASNGNLARRLFAIGPASGITGFNPEQWREKFIKVRLAMLFFIWGLSASIEAPLCLTPVLYCDGDRGTGR
jgi:arsenate reductase